MRSSNSENFIDLKRYELVNVESEISVSFIDVYVTDLAGKLLSIPGEPFERIIEHPEFLTYRNVDDQFYIRTFVRLY